MFLHIGNNSLVFMEDIVGIFNTECIQCSPYNEKYFTDKKTTVVLCKDKKEEILHTNLSIQTMSKRMMIRRKSNVD